MVNGKVVIDVDRCKGCGLCTYTCPANILTLMQDHFNSKGYHPVSVSDPENCVVFTVYRTISQPKGLPISATGG